MTKQQIAEGIKREIAAKVVDQASAGYDKTYMGQWYVVNGAQVVHAADNRPWNPWTDEDGVISVDELVYGVGGANLDGADFDPAAAEDVSENEAYEAAVEFALGYVPAWYSLEAANNE